MGRNMEKWRAYRRTYYANLREAWFKEHGPCKRCSSWDELEVDHIDPSQKVSSKIWSWGREKREAELAKCQPLCAKCHRLKTNQQIRRPAPDHGEVARYTSRSYPCRCEKCKEAWNAYKRSIYTAEGRHARYKRTGY